MSSITQAGMIALFIVGLLIMAGSVFLGTTTQWDGTGAFFIGIILLVIGIVMGIIDKRRNQ